MTDANAPQSHSEPTDSTKLGETVGEADSAAEVAAVHVVPTDRMR